MRERGLKLPPLVFHGRLGRVAPRAGAWIEAAVIATGGDIDAGRSPCGSVD